MSKTNDQSNHDIVYSYNAFNEDLQACGGLPLPISKSQANRIQALTNNTRKPTAAATMQGAHQPPARINGKKKKKARKNKKRSKLEQNDSTGHHHADTQKGAVEASNSGRPGIGKKRLRKMRYLQSQQADSGSSTIDHLLYCAQCCCFTQSVTLLVPSSNKAAPSPSDDGMMTTTTDIRVQPLIVLDLNGILCHRIRNKNEKSYYTAASSTRKKKKAASYPHHHYYRPVAFHIANTPVIPRTDITRFLRYMDQHFCLAVWTSAKNKTAKAMVQQLFPPDIASRLLFIWDQQHCDATTTCCVTNNNTKDNKKANNHHTDTVFVKDLAKVWKQYPLWNANNTILMDDSPDKCTQWHENAVHPPPLHGLLKDKTAIIVASTGEQQQQQQHHHHLMSDEENERLQQLFFEGLVHYWQNHSMTITFDDECGVKTSTKMVEQQGCASLLAAETLNDMDDYSKTNNGLVEFLKIHAVGHMGWE